MITFRLPTHFRRSRFTLGLRVPVVALVLLGLVLAFVPGARSEVVGATNMAGLSTVGAGLPDAGGSVFRVFGALILVVAGFLGLAWLFKNWQRLALQKNATPRLNVMECRSLGPRQAIYVVGYQQQRLLLASSPAGVTLLSHLPAAEESEVAAPAPRPSFAEAFQQILNRKPF